MELAEALLLSPLPGKMQYHQTGTRTLQSGSGVQDSVHLSSWPCHEWLLCQGKSLQFGRDGEVSHLHPHLCVTSQEDWQVMEVSRLCLHPSLGVFLWDSRPVHERAPNGPGSQPKPSMELVCPQRASAPPPHYTDGGPRPIQGGARNPGPCTQALPFSICSCLALSCRFCHPPEVLWVWVVQMIRSEGIQRSPTFLWGVVESLSHIWLFVTTWTAACQASLSFYISQSLLKLMSIVSMRPSNHLILCLPYSSCSQSFPESGSFPVSQLFTSAGQSIEASAPVLPVNIQGWFSLGVTGLIFLQSKGLTRVFSSITIWNHQVF